MALISIIIVGGIIGWLAAMVMGRKEGIFGSIIIGIIGSFIGSYIAQLIGSSTHSYLSFRWSGLLWSFIGSVILVAILNAFSGRTNQHKA